MEIANGSFSIDHPQPQPAYIPTPNDPPWNGWIAMAVWLLSVGFVVVIPLFFVMPYAMQNVDMTNSMALRDFLLTDPTAVILQLAPIIVAHALTLVVAWFVVTRSNTFSFRETLGWNMAGFRWWFAPLITIAFYGITSSLMYVLGDVENEFDIMLKSSRYAVYFVAFFATFTAPLVEEVVYRGLLFSAFQRRFGAAIAIAFVTILFTLIHVPQYSVGATPDYATVIALLLLSLTLTCLRAATNNLLPSIFLHTVFNAISSVALIAEPYLHSVEPVVPPGV